MKRRLQSSRRGGCDARGQKTENCTHNDLDSCEECEEMVPNNRKENDDDESIDPLSTSVSMCQFIYLFIFDNARLERLLEQSNQWMIRQDLNKQHRALRDKIDKAQRELNIIENDFRSRLAAIRHDVMKKVRCDNSRKDGAFRKSDVERLLTTKEIDELHELSVQEKRILNRKKSIGVLIRYLKSINELRMESDNILENMKLVDTLQQAGQSVEFARGVDITQYSNEMCAELKKLSEQISSLSLSKHQQGVVDAAVDDVITAPASGATISEIDLLFMDASSLKADSLAKENVSGRYTMIHS